MYHKNSRKRKISADELNHQYLMELNLSQTFFNIYFYDMRNMMSLIEKHINLDANTVKWIHILDFSSKDNSNANPNWDESMNVPHTEEYWWACKKYISTWLNIISMNPYLDEITL